MSPITPLGRPPAPWAGGPATGTAWPLRLADHRRCALRRRLLLGTAAWGLGLAAGCAQTSRTSQTTQTAQPAAPGPRATPPRSWPLVLTIDDGPLLAPTPLLSPAQRHQALLGALAAHQATAVLFMTVGFGADRPEGLALARAWAHAGHRLANHTVSHLDLHDPTVTMARYLAEVDACEAVGRQLPGWRRWFRATYLHAGRTPAEQQALRQALAERGYLLAEVDIDSRDWAYAAPLQAQLLSTPDPADPAVLALRDRFLAELWARSATVASEAAAEQARTGAAPRPRVLLLHDHLPLALWLPMVLAGLRQQGFDFVPPEAAWPVAAAAEPGASGARQRP